MKLKNPAENQSAGFTLVEVLIAIAILSIGILAWSATQNSNIQGRSTSSSITTALELTQAETERLSKLAKDRQLQEGALEEQRQEQLNNISYQIVSNLYGDSLTSQGKALWLIQVSVSWNRWGSKSLETEKIVVSR